MSPTPQTAPESSEIDPAALDQTPAVPAPDPTLNRWVLIALLLGLIVGALTSG